MKIEFLFYEFIFNFRLSMAPWARKKYYKFAKGFWVVQGLNEVFNDMLYPMAHGHMDA